jgi:CheY-like chemotaxis protein
MLASVLEGSGYKVVTTCNSDEAFQQMEETGFDLVLLAYRLPRITCFKLARLAKRLNAETPVVLISGYSIFAPEELTYVDAYVGTGATLDGLLGTIRSLIAKHHGGVLSERLFRRAQ